ncbi:DUF1214 domain-containing protein [Bradyrhizobium sp. TZ2]
MVTSARSLPLAKVKEGNWLPTAPGRGFFAILRLYGPQAAAVNDSWKPTDFEKMN